jgi:hypothetical protein
MLSKNVKSAQTDFGVARLDGLGDRGNRRGAGLTKLPRSLLPLGEFRAAELLDQPGEIRLVGKERAVQGRHEGE